MDDRKGKWTYALSSEVQPSMAFHRSPDGIDCHVGFFFLPPVAGVQLFQFTFYVKEISVSFNKTYSQMEQKV